MTTAATNNNGLPASAKRILAVLCDGKPHPPVELFDQLDDPEGAKLEQSAGKDLVRWTIHALRKHLAENPKDDRIILCEFFNRRSHYRMVRWLVEGQRHGSSVR